MNAEGRHRRLGDRRGFSMAFALMLLSILLILGLTLGMVGMQNANMIQSASRTESALQAAEAGAEIIRLNLEGNLAYGSTGDMYSGVLSTNQQYWGSFGSGASQSVNNLSGASAVIRSDGSVVPPNCAELIVSARVLGSPEKIVSIGVMMTNRWECAVASSGTFSSAGGLSIKGASTLDQVTAVMAGANGDMPGNIVANSAANPSISIGGNPTITGTLYTPGSASVPASITSIEHVSLPIPNITWSFYAPESTSPYYELLGSGSYNSLNLPINAGRTEIHRKGSLNISGGLRLDNCTLSVDGNLAVGGTLKMTNSKIYVNGNMSVAGGIKGVTGNADSTGAIFVCGENHTFSLSGTANLNTTNATGMALYSQGDISLTGGAHFQGVVYSRGDIQGRGGSRVIGVAIANGNANTYLTFTGGAEFIYCPVYLKSLIAMSSNIRLRKLSWRIAQ